MNTRRHSVNTAFYGKNVLVHNFGYQSWLNISNLTVSDKGNYTLTVANEIDKVEYNFRIAFKGIYFYLTKN